MSCRFSPVLRAGRRALAFCLLLVAVACQTVSPPAFSSDIDELLARGDAYAQALAARPPGELSDADVLALGYLERARLGLGSPFRLIAYVRRDERLPPALRDDLAYAVLHHTLAGRGYQVDASVLDLLRFRGAAVNPGEYHLSLIERLVTEALTAQSGERAVRLGYLLASEERTIEGSPEPVVSLVAAMVADRRKAREDAVDLLRTAAAHGRDPLELLEVWRRDRRFRVEQPAMGVVLAREEIAEARRGTQLATTLRLLGQRLSASGSARFPLPPHEEYWAASWLGAVPAARLETLSAAHDYPAQAPVAVAVAINRQAFIERPGLTPWQQTQRTRFAEAAINEERLVAGAARLRTVGAAMGARLPLILLQSAVFLRGWNQEEPWLPGDAGPSARDLENRFGLASVSFDADVPEAWRPYYRRMLGRALADLQRALPAASLRGLNVRIGAVPSSMSALAVHEPRTRTLILPPHSGAGTIAHEVAHDLDWQLARKRYARRGAYASDLAVQRQAGDRIAASLAGLAASFARSPEGGTASPHDQRAAEVFARGVDWLVAAHLASEGRTGGYLTSFQDAAIVGYGTTRGPQLSGDAVPALLTILEQIAPVVPETRQWALDSYGPTRSLTAKELARAITAATREGSVFERLAALRAARDRAWEGLTAASCRMEASSDARRLLSARQHAIRAAVAAAGRGVIVDGIYAVAQELDDPPARRSVEAFLTWRLDGGPEPADSSVHRLEPAADELIFRVRELDADPPVAGGGFELQPERTLCGGNPFASQAPLWRGALAVPFGTRPPTGRD